MLVLTRRCGEQLVIANDIVVTVVAIEGNKIRLGVEAPPAIRVDRKEVHQRRILDRAADVGLCSGVTPSTARAVEPVHA